MIYTRRFWRHTSVLATRSFGQGVVTALGGDMLGVWQELDAKAVLFAGAGMAIASVAMSLGRATVAPRKDTPPELQAINDMIDKHFADAYTDPGWASPAPEPKRHSEPAGNSGLQSSYENLQQDSGVGLQASYSFGQTPGKTADFDPDYHPFRSGW